MAHDEDEDSAGQETAKPRGPNYISRAGLQRLTDERDQLRKVERPRVVGEVAEAAAMGDRSENAEYIYGKRRLREIDRRLRFLEGRIDAAVVVDAAAQTRRDRVYFGATVTTEAADGSERTWTLVGEDEVDLALGWISHRSPMGAALMGKQVDDEVRVMTPGGVRTLAIVAIRWPD
jgi:transcription elongation factor GreB